MMKTFFGAAGLAIGASAAILPRDQCCFQITASGGQSGIVGQLDDGQNRVGGGLPAGSYCLNNGAITDSQGRGCILTSPTSQFQCDTGATPSSGFTVSENGEVQYHGNSQFYACGAGSGEYNLYTTPVSGQEDCTEVTLNTGGKCSGSGSGGSSSSAPSPPAYTQSSQGSVPSAPSNSQPTQQPGPSAPAYSQPSKQPGLSAPSNSQPTQQPSPSAPAYGQSSGSACEIPSGGQQITTSILYTTVTSTLSVPASTGIATSTPSVGNSSESQPGQTQPSQYQPSQSQPGQPQPNQSQPAQSQPNQSQPGQSQPSQTQPIDTQTGPAQSATSAQQPSASGSACQTSLTGAYQTPHLIVPVSSAQPDKAYGTQYNATINSGECTIFTFDIPSSYSGKSCSTVFLFPQQSQLETSGFDFSGSGDLVFSQLSSAASEQTTWNNCPSKKDELASVAVQPGNSYAISTASCAAGTTQSIEVCGTTGLTLEFFQDWNPSPIGVYITSC